MPNAFTYPNVLMLPKPPLASNPLAIEMCNVGQLNQKLQPALDAAWQQVSQHGRYILGPEVARFEAALSAYLGLAHNHAIGCANGTGALWLIMATAKLSKGAHVLVPAFTYIAAAEAIARAGLVPIPVEPDTSTYNITADTLRAAATPQTEAVVAVHLFGRAAPMQPIVEFCQQNNYFLVEDVAQALGATAIAENGQAKPVGTFGQAAAFSFFPTKPLGALGDAGAVLTTDAQMADRVRSLSRHGKGSHKYQHTHVGDNNRLDTLQAAFLLAKLPYLEACHQARQQVAQQYNQLLGTSPYITLPAPAPNPERHVWHQYTLQTPHRDALQKHLLAQGIPTMVYYPTAQHMQPAYQNPNYPLGSLPVTEQLCRQVLSLPMHTELTHAHISKITQAINGFTP